MYGLDTLVLSTSEKSTLDFIYSSVFFKIFNVKEKLCISQCQFYSGCLPASYKLDLLKLNFLHSLINANESLQFQLFVLLESDEFALLRSKYNIAPRDGAAAAKAKVWKQFGQDLKI